MQMIVRYATASANSASDIGCPHGGKTPVACSTTSTAVVITKIVANPASSEPVVFIVVSVSFTDTSKEQTTNRHEARNFLRASVSASGIERRTQNAEEELRTEVALRARLFLNSSSAFCVQSSGSLAHLKHLLTRGVVL